MKARLITAVALVLAAPALAASTWDLWGEKDEMGRGTVQFATTTSSNSLEFKFPYAGAQKAWLMLRARPRHEPEAVVQIQRGQFVCRIEGCVVTVRFDDGAPERFYGANTSDGSTTILFIRPSDRFLALLRKSKRVRIEAEFYQEGLRVLDFATDGLGQWPPK